MFVQYNGKLFSSYYKYSECTKLLEYFEIGQGYWQSSKLYLIYAASIHLTYYIIRYEESKQSDTVNLVLGSNL